jgi:heme exporter protein D
MTWNRDEVKTALRDALETNHARQRAMQRTPHAQGHYSTRNTHALGATAAPVLDDWDRAHFETPGRSPTVAGDVLTPVLQSVVSGILAGGLVGVAILATEAPVSGWAAAGVGLLVTAGAWGWLLRDHRRLLRTVEDYTRRDAEPLTQTQAETLRLEVVKDEGDGRAHWLFEDLDTDAETLTQWGRAVLGGRSLAQSGWTGKGGPFSRSEYDALLAAMIRAGVVRWNNPKAHAQGATLTAMGRATLRRLVEVGQ